MLLFHFNDYRAMACALLERSCLRDGRFAVNRYANQELYVTVPVAVSGQNCMILGSVAPPDEQMLSVLLLAHTLKKEGARRVTGLIPYLAYTRQDKKKPGESIATAWVGSLFGASGVDEILTVDVHSRRDSELFPMPLISLSTADLFADAIRQHGLTDATIVAPDNGAIERCRRVMDTAGIEGQVVYCEKTRTMEGVVHTAVTGEAGPRAVVIDDVLDTGGTLVSACEKLQERGVNEIHVMVTHGLFTGSSWNKLWALGVKTIFCTDTITLRNGLEPQAIVRLSVVPLLRTRLKEVNLDDQGTD
jgi:ribose-phosphate pyrophosphokinase